MMRHRKDSLRLQGYDYSESGEYFVTICTSGRRCVLGEVADGKMGLSEIGRIVEGCWHGIPQHFPGTRVRVLQVMPNHVHGIVDLARVGAQHAAPLQAASKKPTPGSLGVIVRSFKSATTKIARDAGVFPNCPLWQRGYYDRIIRDDTERYFIERYIALNPLLWSLDRNNLDRLVLSVDEMRRMLREKSGLQHVK